MNTQHLTKTNLIPEEQAAIIEEIIGCEINRTITYNANIRKGSIVITPYTRVNNGHYEFRYLNYVVKDVSFNEVTGVLTVVSRKRWQRSFVHTYYQLQIIGYKLPTTNIRAGYVWGNAQPA